MPPIVHVTTKLDIPGGILVGHDGSQASSDAVRWAARLAARLGSPLHVVRSWKMSSAPRPSTAETGYVPPLDHFEAAVLERLREDIARLDLPAEVTVEHHTLHGPAGRRLVEASHSGADMLVVGSRGGGGFHGLVFGSTAEQVVKNAGCPVVVVPVEPAGDAPELDSQLEV